MQADYDVLPCQCGRWVHGESNFTIVPIRVKHVYNDIVETEQDKWKLKCRRCPVHVVANTKVMTYALWNGANKSNGPKPYTFIARRIRVRKT